MEKSVKRVEKLVHATNSALAQMKLSLMFDDGLMGGERSFRRTQAWEPKFCLEGEDLKQCQQEFRAEANDMLAKMDKMFGSSDPSRKNLTALERIKEINRKMNLGMQDHPKLRGTQQSSEKLVSLIAEEKLSPQKPPSKGSLRPKHPPPPKRETQPSDNHHRIPKNPPPSLSPPKSKEDLKTNILETHQVVDRGLHTARHLAQKVDSMARSSRKDSTPGPDKPPAELNPNGLNVKSESSETVKSSKGERKGGDAVGEGQPRNARVVEVKGREWRRRRRGNLRVVRLPSVAIRGGLQLQRVHSLEIPPGDGQGGCGKTNTGIRILSHEQLARARAEEVVDEGRGGSCVECTNCGKVMRVRGKWVDPRRLDEVLRKCGFNVFDPRIDEFVERWLGVEGWEKRGEDEVRAEGNEKRKEQQAQEQPKASKGFSLEDLSKRLSTRYRQEAEDLEGHHLRVSSLLKSVLRKIEESREVFEECHLFRNESAKRERVLTVTEPVVVGLTGSPVGSGSEQKLEKRDLKKRSTRRTERPESRSLEGIVKRKKNAEEKRRKKKEGMMMTSWVVDGGGGDGSGSKREGGAEEQKARSPAATSRDWSWSSSQPEEGPVPELRVWRDEKRDSVTLRESTGEERAVSVRSVPSSVSSNSERQNFRPHTADGDMSPEASFKMKDTDSDEGKALSEVSTERSDNNYESDFESLTNGPEEGGGECEDAEAELVPCSKKLSTISEVDSELERKLSDEQKTRAGSLNSDEQKTRAGSLNGDDPKPSDEGPLWNHQPTAFDGRGKRNTSLTPETSHETSKAERTPSLKSTPTELVTSLNEILSALKDQFARTETLAEKLTENVKQDREEALSRESPPTDDGMGSPWKMPVGRLVENLRSARRDPTGGPKSGSGSGRSRKCEDLVSADSLSDEGGSSLGEVVVGGQRRCEGLVSESNFLKPEGSRGSSWLSSDRKEAPKTKLNVNSDELSYSEGEIPSNMMVDSECCSSGSVGEVRH